MCNLYSITTNQAAIIDLFRVVNRYVGNPPPMPGVFPWRATPAPVGWVLFLDDERVGGVHGTKEAAFQAVMVAASFAIRSGDGVPNNAPSEANMRATKKPDPWPKEWIAFLK
jgi:hypothetical protein